MREFLILSRVIGHTGVDAKKLTVKLWGKGVVEKTDSYGGSKNTQYYIRRAGQLMYGKLDFLHAAFGLVPAELDGYESTLDSPAFDLVNVDGRFLLDRITQESFYLKNGMIANGSRKAKRIHEDTFLDMPLALPTFKEQQAIGSFFSHLDDLVTLHQRKRQWLKWLDEGGEGTHHDIDILVFKFADDMKISVLCGVHACMTKSLGHTGNRYAGKQQQRGMGVP